MMSGHVSGPKHAPIWRAFISVTRTKLLSRLVHILSHAMGADPAQPKRVLLATLDEALKTLARGRTLILDARGAHCDGQWISGRVGLGGRWVDGTRQSHHEDGSGPRHPSFSVVS